MPSVLGPGEGLTRADVPGLSELTSPHGDYTLVLQPDGNLVLYNNRTRERLWSSGTGGQAVRTAIMQHDGNFVIYGFPDPIWATATPGHAGSFLAVQDDGSVVIYQPKAPLWTTKTSS